MRTKFILESLIAAAVFLDSGFLARAGDNYYLLKEIAVGGVPGTPSLAMDGEGRRLYLTHSAKVDVLDLETETLSGSIANTSSAHSFAVAPKLNRGFVSESRDGTVHIIDLKTTKVTGSVKTGAGGSLLLFEPAEETVYAFNTRTPSATIFEAADGKVIATVTLSGKPGPVAADSELGRVYCALPDQNELAVIDTKSHEVTATWPIAPGKQPAAVAVDAVNHRVFVGCRNKQLVMIDGKSGKLASSAAIGSGVDGAAFDLSTHLVFCANSDGTTSILHEDAPDKLTLSQTLTTERNARILALDPKTHKIYLTTTDFEAQLPPDEGARSTRPRTLPNTLKILVYGPASQ